MYHLAVSPLVGLHVPELVSPSAPKQPSWVRDSRVHFLFLHVCAPGMLFAAMRLRSVLVSQSPQGFAVEVLFVVVGSLHWPAGQHHAVPVVFAVDGVGECSEEFP